MRRLDRIILGAQVDRRRQLPACHVVGRQQIGQFAQSPARAEPAVEREHVDANERKPGSGGGIYLCRKR